MNVKHIAVQILASPVVVCSVLGIDVVSQFGQTLLSTPMCPFVAVAFFYMGTVLWGLGGYLMKPDYLLPEVTAAFAPHARFIRARRELTLQQLAMFGALVGLSGGLWISALGFNTTGSGTLPLVAEYPLDGAVGFFFWALYLLYTLPGAHQRLALSSPCLWEPVGEADCEALRQQSLAYKSGLRNRSEVDAHSLRLIEAALNRRDASILDLVNTRLAVLPMELRPIAADRIWLSSMNFAFAFATIAAWLLPVVLGCGLVYVLICSSWGGLHLPTLSLHLSLSFRLTLMALAILCVVWAWFTRPIFLRKKRGRGSFGV